MTKTTKAKPKTKTGAVIARVREPSSLAGLAALGSLAVMAGLIPPGTPELIAQGVAALAGVAAVFVPEGGGHDGSE